MEWKFERVEQKFEVLPVGKYRIRIKDAEKAVSKNSGNDMLILTFEVSGSNQTLMYYIPFLAEKPEVTNRMLTQFFDSFGIDGDFNLQGWKGKVGGCQTKIEEYDGKETAKVAYFINKKQQESLPAWQDGENKQRVELTPVEDDDDMPF